MHKLFLSSCVFSFYHDIFINSWPKSGCKTNFYPHFNQEQLELEPKYLPQEHTYYGKVLIDLGQAEFNFLSRCHKVITAVCVFPVMWLGGHMVSCFSSLCERVCLLLSKAQLIGLITSRS